MCWNPSEQNFVCGSKVVKGTLQVLAFFRIYYQKILDTHHQSYYINPIKFLINIELFKSKVLLISLLKLFKTSTKFWVPLLLKKITMIRKTLLMNLEWSNACQDSMTTRFLPPVNSNQFSVLFQVFNRRKIWKESTGRSNPTFNVRGTLQQM